MAISRCPHGHFYDDFKFSTCPHCGVTLSGSLKGGGTGGMKDAAADAEVTIAKPRIPDEGITIAKAFEDDEKTRSIFSGKAQREPVVGWLVCTEGKEKGRDYRLHAEKNYVGRSSKMDVSIYDDPEISRENHFCIVFEPKKSEFIAIQGENSVSVNGEPLMNSKKIQSEDVLCFGGSEFVLITFCKEGRTW